MYTAFSRTLKPIGIFLTTVILLAITHFVLVHSYVTFCVPTGFMGLVASAFTIGSPVCQHMNFVQTAIATYYTQIWGSAAVGTSLWIANRVSTKPLENTWNHTDAKTKWKNLKSVVKDQ